MNGCVQQLLAAGRLGRCGVVALVLMAAVSSSAAAESVRLADRAWSAGPSVTLAEVAALSGERAQALGDVVVGRFDGEAEVLSVSLDEVRAAMTDRGVHWGRMSLQGFASCRVQRVEATPAVRETAPGGSAEDASATAGPGVGDGASAATLRGAIEAMLVGATGLPREQLVLTFREQDAARLGRSVVLERYEIEPSTSSVLGRVPIRVRRYEGEQMVESFAVTVDVQRRVRALVATQAISRDERFGAGNVAVREVLVDHGRGELMTSLDEVAGLEAAGAVREGSVIWDEDVRSPVLVRRGELVTVRCMVGPLMIRTVGRAREAGVAGEMIQVRNETSREMYYAKVTGRREVVVELGGGGVGEQQPIETVSLGGQP